MIAGFISNDVVFKNTIEEFLEEYGQNIKEKEENDILAHANMKILTPNFENLKLNTSLLKTSYQDYIEDRKIYSIPEIEYTSLENDKTKKKEYNELISLGNLLKNSKSFNFDNYQENIGNEKVNPAERKKNVITFLEKFPEATLDEANNFLNIAGNNLEMAMDLYKENKGI